MFTDKKKAYKQHCENCVYFRTHDNARYCLNDYYTNHSRGTIQAYNDIITKAKYRGTRCLNNSLYQQRLLNNCKLQNLKRTGGPSIEIGEDSIMNEDPYAFTQHSVPYPVHCAECIYLHYVEPNFWCAICLNMTRFPKAQSYIILKEGNKVSKKALKLCYLQSRKNTVIGGEFNHA